MKLSVFRSSKGDCLLLQGENGANLLIDGGMGNTYREFVRPTLGAMAEAGQALDLVYVSHIDQDHIAGILELMEDTVAWKRFDYQQASGNAEFDPPEFPRPPEVKALWHNAFADQVGENQGPIEDQLVTNTRLTSAWTLFQGEQRETIFNMAGEYQNLAASIRQGLEITRRAWRQLNIPLNPQTGGKLFSVEDVAEAIPLGSLSLSVIGPFQVDLENLREDWNQWLKNNRDVVEEIQAEIEADLAEHAGLRVMDEGQLLASMLRPLITALGDRSAVTPPNLASLMLLAEEGEHTVLLTGDGHADDILKGLERRGKLNGEGRLHVDVLKFQHHGSKNNITADFCRKITAPHYVFCGNGDHHNPHLDAVELLVEARAGLTGDHPQAGQPYKLWFNCSSRVASTKKRREHMALLEEKVAALGAEHPELSWHFSDSASFQVPVGGE